MSLKLTDQQSLQFRGTLAGKPWSTRVPQTATLMVLHGLMALLFATAGGLMRLFGRRA